MNVDDLVRRSLADHAQTVTPPVVDPESYVRRGLKRERLRVAGASALVALVVAGVSVPWLIRDDRPPEPATELEELGVEGALWLDDAGIHFDGTVVEPPQGVDQVTQLAPVSGGAVYVAEDSKKQDDVSVWFIDTTGEARKLTDDGPGAGQSLVTDPSAALAAWVQWNRDSQTAEFVVVDANSGTELARERVQPAAWRIWEVVSVTADSVVATNLPFWESRVWSIGSDGLVRLGVGGRQVVLDSKGGAQIIMEIDGGEAVRAIVDSSGREVDLPAHALAPMELSPDGRFAFFVDAAEVPGRMSLLDLQTGESTPLIPEASADEIDFDPAWVDQDTFMIIQRNEAGTEHRVVACEAPSARCAAATGWQPESSHLVVPLGGSPS
jgi:hypothetical protein